MTSPSIAIDGELWHQYFSEYDFEGGTYSIYIYARSDDEAVARLRAIRQQCIEATRIHGGVAVDAPLALWRVRFACWWRNLFRV